MQSGTLGRPPLQIWPGSTAMASEASLDTRYRHHKSRHRAYKTKYLRAQRVLLQLRLWLCFAVLALSAVSFVAADLKQSQRKAQDEMNQVLVANSRLRQALNRRGQAIANQRTRPPLSEPRHDDRDVNGGGHHIVG